MAANLTSSSTSSLDFPCDPGTCVCCWDCVGAACGGDAGLGGAACGDAGLGGFACGGEDGCGGGGDSTDTSLVSLSEFTSSQLSITQRNTVEGTADNEGCLAYFSHNHTVGSSKAILPHSFLYDY